MDKLNTYTIEITETLQKQIKVQAENADDAIQQTKEDYDDEKIVLNENDMMDLRVDLLPNKL